MDTTPPNHRSIVHSLLPPTTTYVPLQPGTKILQGTRKENERKQLHTPPSPKESPTYGIVPGPGLLVLDFDGTEEEVMEGLQKFSKLLGFNILKESLASRSASGGVHVWLRIPEDETIWATKLSQMVPGTKGDVRSSARFGYVVGPGSYSPDGQYSIIFPSKGSSKDSVPRPKKLTFEQVKKLQTVPDPSTRQLPTGENILPNDRITLQKLPASLVEQLTKTVGKYESWHGKRSAVYAALSCCYDDKTIVRAWWELDICRNTAKNNRKMSSQEVWSDVTRLVRSESHGGYCPGRRNGSVSVEQTSLNVSAKDHTFTLDDYWNYKAMKVRQSSEWKEPIVVNLVKVAEAIGVTRYSDRVKSLAFAMVEKVVQRWVNFGCRNVVMGDVFLRGFFNASSSDVHKAKALLRQVGVLVQTVRQSPKTTSAYRVDEDFVHVPLSKLLQSAVYGKKETLSMDLRAGEVYNPFTGEVVVDLFAQGETDRFYPEVETVGSLFQGEAPRNDFWSSHGPSEWVSYVPVKQKRGVPRVVSEVADVPVTSEAPCGIVVDSIVLDTIDTVLASLPELSPVSYIPSTAQGMMRNTLNMKYDPELNEKLEEALRKIFTVTVPVFTLGLDEDFEYAPAIWVDRKTCTFQVNGDEFGFLKVDLDNGLVQNMYQPGMVQVPSKYGSSWVHRPVWDRADFLDYLVKNEEELRDGVQRFWMTPKNVKRFLSSWESTEYWTGVYAGYAADEVPDEVDSGHWKVVRRALWVHDELFHKDGSGCSHEGVDDVRSKYGLNVERFVEPLQMMGEYPSWRDWVQLKRDSPVVRSLSQTVESIRMVSTDFFGDPVMAVLDHDVDIVLPREFVS